MGLNNKHVVNQRPFRPVEYLQFNNLVFLHFLYHWFHICGTRAGLLVVRELKAYILTQNSVRFKTKKAIIKIPTKTQKKISQS